MEVGKEREEITNLKINFFKYNKIEKHKKRKLKLKKRGQIDRERQVNGYYYYRVGERKQWVTQDCEEYRNLESDTHLTSCKEDVTTHKLYMNQTH